MAETTGLDETLLTTENSKYYFCNKIFQRIERDQDFKNVHEYPIRSFFKIMIEKLNFIGLVQTLQTECAMVDSDDIPMKALTAKATHYVKSIRHCISVPNSDHLAPPVPIFQSAEILF